MKQSRINKAMNYIIYDFFIFNSIFYINDKTLVGGGNLIVKNFSEQCEFYEEINLSVFSSAVGHCK